MNNRIIKRIVIKQYQEFTEELELEGVIAEVFIVAKEVEAVIELEGGQTFSLGFSVTREDPLFQYESPRRLVQNFLLNNFKFDIDIKE